LTDFDTADAQVFLVVPHERCRTQWWTDRAGGELAVLADPAFWVSSLYGVAFQMRIHSDTSNTPGTFVIDKRGILRSSHIGTGRRNFMDRPSASETLTKVKELSDNCP